MKKITLLTALIAIVMVSALTLLAPESSVVALDPSAGVKDGINAAGGTGDTGNVLPGSIRDIINVLLFVIGAVAVIMIVIGGLRYTISNGDSAQVTSAKNTVLYAVIGLVIAMLAYAIVNFVVGAF